MTIDMLDTEAMYRRMLTLPAGERGAFFAQTLLGPYAPMLDALGMPAEPGALNCLPITPQADGQAQAFLDSLRGADAWARAQAAARAAFKEFAAAGVPMPERILVGIFLADPDKLAFTRGYTGLGSIPGYIQIFIAPNAYNLPRLEACVVHELHHNVYLWNATWDFMREVTVARYLAVEGLAESFAQSLYGADALGPWVTDISAPDLQRARALVRDALTLQGFELVRRYIYGDHPMMPDSSKIGMPYCGGYAVGYHAVQAYLRRHSVSVASLTRLDGLKIMRESGYWD